MPYIPIEKREKINPSVMELMTKIETAGDYNYAITRLLHTFIERKGLSYENLNAAIGIIECVKQEFNRTVVVPYEEEKKKNNGSVSSLDSTKKNI